MGCGEGLILHESTLGEIAEHPLNGIQNPASDVSPTQLKGK
jgi:hypothetical protein